MSDPTPPRWAEAWLRLLLPPRDRDTVSGDLLEEYRVNIRPRRSQLAANLWYVRQVSVFAWRIALWALALATVFVTRTAYDWFVPTNDFSNRSEVTTIVSVAIYLVIGASTALRTRSVGAAAVSAFAASTLAAALCTIATALLYLGWHDPSTLGAVDASGGLAEVFQLPVLLILPGTVLGCVGAAFAAFRYRWGSA